MSAWGQILGVIFLLYAGAFVLVGLVLMWCVPCGAYCTCQKCKGPPSS